MLFLFSELLLELARMARRRSWLVHESKSRAIGWFDAIGRTCPCPNSVAPRVVLHSPAGPVRLPSEIRAPHFHCINHATRTYAARYSLFEPKTQILDCPPTWSQIAHCTILQRQQPGAHPVFRFGSALSRITCIDGDHRAGNVSACLAQQEHDAMGDVDRFRHTVQSAAPRDCLALRLAQFVRHFRVDEAAG